MATNAKHPRYAPGLVARLATQRNRRGYYWLREKVCRELGGCARFAFGFGVRSAGTRVRAGGLRGVVPGRPAAGRRTPDAGRRTQDAGRWAPDVGRRAPDAGRSETPDPRRQDALDPGFHGVPQGPAPGSGADRERRPEAGRAGIPGGGGFRGGGGWLGVKGTG